MGKSTRKPKGSPVPPSSKRQKLDEDTPDGTASPPPRKTADIMQSLDLGPMLKPFKNPDYSAPRAVKKLKQIMALEKALDRPLDFPTYWNIEAPPSFTPAKKYCDITGLEAPYTDPKSGLRYHNSDVYQFIRTLQPQHIQMYLELRNAAVKL
ncbi:YL1 nuclear protein C-terminal domain-containing protein [Powellomyces hirtus]|nr:YL1 nuclear protein C-terminal domain-containing protein [Powellomyces hirtus]